MTPLKIIWRRHLTAPIIVMVIYLLTLAPGVYGYDSAELATGAYTLGIVHPTGYPLYLVLGKLFTYLPIGSVAYRVNLMSAFFGMLTVWMTAALTARWSQDRLFAALAGLALGLAPAFWSMSLVAEVYTLHTFLLATALWLALAWRDHGRRRWVVGLGLVAGLSLTNHSTSLLYLPALIWLALPRWRIEGWRRWLPTSLLAFLLGLCLYLYLPIRDAMGAELNYVNSYYNVDLTRPQGLLWMISGQAYRFFAFAYRPAAYLHEVGRVLLALWHNLTGLGLLLSLPGLIWLVRRQRAVAAATAWILLVTLGFFAGYAVSDKMTMLLPAYLILAQWMGAGARYSHELVMNLSIPVARSLRRALLPSLLAVMTLTVVGLSWPRVDKSRASGAEAFALQTLSGLEHESIIVSEWSPAVTLEYFQQVEGVRPDVEVFNRSRFEVAAYYGLWREGVGHSEALRTIGELETKAIQTLATGRSLYGTSYDPMLANEYEYLPSGPVFQMVPKDTGAETSS